MTEVVAVKPLKISERPKMVPQRAVWTVRILRVLSLSNLSRSPRLKRAYPKEICGGWLLPNGVNCPPRGHIKCSK